VKKGTGKRGIDRLCLGQKKEKKKGDIPAL
jgi:hypothetical protein